MNNGDRNEQLKSADWKTIFTLLDEAEFPEDFLSNRYEGLSEDSPRDFDSWTEPNFGSRQ